MRKFIAIKEKSFFIPIQITFNYNQKCHPLHLRDTWYKKFPQKKKKTSGRKKEGEGKERVEEGGKKEGEGKERAEEGKGKERDGKEKKKKKRDGKSLCERKGKRENEMWKKRGKEGEGE